MVLPPFSPNFTKYFQFACKFQSNSDTTGHQSQTIFGNVISISFGSFECATAMLCNALKYDTSTVLPKVDGQHMFLAVKFVFLITASSNRRQSEDLKERSLKIGRNLSFEVRKGGLMLLRFETKKLLEFPGD